MNEIATEVKIPDRYVDAPKLLETLFDESCRPSLRWLRTQTAKRRIPHVKIGQLVFFDPPIVRAHLNARATIHGKKGVKA